MQDSGLLAASGGSPAGNRTIAAVAVSLLLLLAVLYIAFAPPPQRQSYDSLMYPSRAEERGFAAVQGNHPLGHVIHVAGFLLARQLGYDGRALPVFEGINAVASACAMSLLFLLLVRVVGNSILSSAAIVVIVAGSWGVRYLAGTGEIYSLAIAFQILAWAALLVETRQPRRRLLLLSGACAGLAVLAHQLNAVLLLAGIVLILGQRTHRWSRTVSFLCSTALVAGMGTLLFGALATSSTSLTAIVPWARGYIGTYAITGLFLTWANLPVAWSGATEGALLGGSRGAALRYAIWGAAGLLVLWGVAQWRSLRPGRRTILIAALAQWVASFLLIWYWEPFTPKYWALTLAPAALALASLAGSFVQATRLRAFRDSRVLALGSRILLVALGMVFLLLTVYRGMERSRTPAPGDAWAAHSSAQDLLIPPPELDAYLRYWAHRPNTENLTPATMVEAGVAGRLDALRSAIDDALCNDRSVYFAPAIIDMLNQEDFDRFAPSGAREQLRLFFAGYQQQAAFSYIDSGQTIQVNRIAGPTHCYKDRQ